MKKIKLFFLALLQRILRAPIPTIIMICDPNHNDLDDESALVVVNTLIRLGFIRLLAAVIANTNPEYLRANVARGLLNFLGLNMVPVGVGDRVMPEPEPCPDIELITYIDRNTRLPDGKQMLLEKLLRAESNSITLVVDAAMTEVKWLLKDYRDLFVQKVTRVVFMGGVDQQLSPNGYILPGDAMNVHFDEKAAEYCYQVLQDLGIPMTITTRNATFAAMLKHKIFAKMGKIGECFAVRVDRNTQRFWRGCCAPVGHPLRGKLSPSRNREWFVKTFCGGADPGISDSEDILPYVISNSWPQYDPINLVASIPFLRDLFFNPKIIVVNGIEHLVIGWSAKEHGIKRPNKFVSFLESLLIYGSV